MSDVTQYDRACRTPACLQPAPTHRTGTRHPPSPPLRAPFARFLSLQPLGPDRAGGLS